MNRLNFTLFFTSALFFTGMLGAQVTLVRDYSYNSPFSDEEGWEIVNVATNEVVDCQQGNLNFQYANSNQVLLLVPPGTYEIRAFDVFGDGWDGASTITIIDCMSNSIICGPVRLDTGGVQNTCPGPSPNGVVLCTFVAGYVYPSMPPQMICPATQTLSLDANCQAMVPDYRGLATIERTCAIEYTQNPAPGTLVSGPGSFNVQLMISDFNGRSSSCSFMVNKVGGSALEITCVNDQVTFNGQNSIALNAEDLVMIGQNCGIQSIILSPSSVTPAQVGQTIPVTVTVIEEGGNSASCTSQVTVSGLPAGWSQDPDGIGCPDGSDIAFNAETEVWTATSTNCFYASPYTTDALSFAEYSICGNGSITAEVTGISGTSQGWAGVVMRESDAPGAKKAQLTTNMGPFSRREFRLTTNGMSVPQQFSSLGRRWLRIERIGNQFTMYHSANGLSWAFAGSQTISMNSCIIMGLVVSNYSSSSTVSATFDNVSVTGSNPVPLIGLGEGSDKGGDKSGFLQMADFRVYPNPSTGLITIDLKAFEGQDLDIEIFNSMGQRVLLVEMEDTVQNPEIDLGKYGQGIFTVRIVAENLPAMMKRVVISR